MATSVRFEVQGMSELLDQLDQFDPAVQRAKKKALEAGAEIILEQMQKNAEPHKRTGRLSGALRISKRTGNSGNSINVGVFGNDAPAAHLVEMGHGGPKPAPAYPFMEPAMLEKQDEAADAMMQVLGEAIP